MKVQYNIVFIVEKEGILNLQQHKKAFPIGKAVDLLHRIKNLFNNNLSREFSLRITKF